MSAPTASRNEKPPSEGHFGDHAPTLDLTPQHAAKIASDLARPTGVEFGHHRVDYGDRPFETQSANYLSDDHEWHAPGLAYGLLGLDKSLYGLYADGAGITLPVLTHRIQEPILYVEGAPSSQNPWLYTVQGVPRDAGAAVRAFVETYLFRTPNGQQWRCSWVKESLQDPLWKGHSRTIPLWVLCVRNLSTGRRFEPQEGLPGACRASIPLQLVCGIVEAV